MRAPYTLFFEARGARLGAFSRADPLIFVPVAQRRSSDARGVRNRASKHQCSIWNARGAEIASTEIDAGRSFFSPAALARVGCTVRAGAGWSLPRWRGSFLLF
jgi:hypothetical protein